MNPQSRPPVPPPTPQYQGVFESVTDHADGFSIVTLRAKKGKQRVYLRVETKEVKRELIGHFVTMLAKVEEVSAP